MKIVLGVAMLALRETMMRSQFGKRRVEVATVLAACLIGGPATIRVRAAEPEASWPAPVPGHVAPAPGEHPRLFFRVADITGEWKATPGPDFPDGLVRIQRDGNRLTVPRCVQGELRWKGADITWTTFTPRGASSRRGRISACGSLIDYFSAIEWRRVGSAATRPAPWGGADDARSRLTSGTLAGKPLAVLTFGENGHPAVTIEADGVRVGERHWRLEQGRLTPTSHQ